MSVGGMRVMKMTDNFKEFFSMRVITMFVGGDDDNNVSHNKYDNTAYNREKYKPTFSVMGGKNKGDGHTRRRLRKLCDTDDEDNAEENQEILGRPRKKNNEKTACQSVGNEGGSGERGSKDKK